MKELEQASITDRYLDYINQIDNLDLLVDDDFGLMELDLDKHMILITLGYSLMSQLNYNALNVLNSSSRLIGGGFASSF